jgi:hypothetical protein
LDRSSMEHELRTRDIFVFRPSVDDVRHDLASLEQLEHE